MARIRYLRRDDMELIVCERSVISYPLHNHVSVFTLGLVLDGEIELAADQDVGIYRKDGAFMILPYVPHRINARSRYTLLSLCISARMMADAGREEIRSAAAAFLRDTVNRPAIEEKMMQELASLIDIGRRMPVQQKTAISGLRTQLERYPEHKRSVAGMASAVFISKYEFIRTFKREVGLTPCQFQIQNRVRKAQRMLEGPATAAEAAQAAGFYDQSHLIRHFEKIVGMTPADYKLACAAASPSAK